ncbi:MAG: pantetheine-phosphate adenylyltransferase [Bulleidia sp.]
MKAIYPGTFDPITNGHLDIIERASHAFDEVTVVIMRNPNKHVLFTEEERAEMIEKSIEALTNVHNVHVAIGSGLTVKFARAHHAGVIIRGIRAVSDYEYELQQATANLMLDDTIETLFFIARPEYSFLSSSAVKEIGSNGGSLEGFVPRPIIGRVTEKLQQI